MKLQLLTLLAVTSGIETSFASSNDMSSTQGTPPTTSAAAPNLSALTQSIWDGIDASSQPTKRQRLDEQPVGQSAVPAKQASIIPIKLSHIAPSASPSLTNVVTTSVKQTAQPAPSPSSNSQTAATRAGAISMSAPKVIASMQQTLFPGNILQSRSIVNVSKPPQIALDAPSYLPPRGMGTIHPQTKVTATPITPPLPSATNTGRLKLTMQSLPDEPISLCGTQPYSLAEQEALIRQYTQQYKGISSKVTYKKWLQTHLESKPLRASLSELTSELIAQRGPFDEWLFGEPYRKTYSYLERFKVLLGLDPTGPCTFRADGCLFQQDPTTKTISVQISFGNLVLLPFFKPIEPQKITSLSAASCDLLSSWCLMELPALTSLNLSRNRIGSLSVSGLPANLTSLNLSNNPLKNWTVPMPNNLVELVLSYTGLSALPNLPLTLRRLDIQGNKFQTLQNVANLELLTNLEALDASRNALGGCSLIPPSLQRLDVSRNMFNELPDFSRLKNLVYLNIGVNELPKLLSSLLPQSLETLAAEMMASPRQRAVSVNLAGLPNLKNLFLGLADQFLHELVLPPQQFQILCLSPTVLKRLSQPHQERASACEGISISTIYKPSTEHLWDLDLEKWITLNLQSKKGNSNAS